MSGGPYRSRESVSSLLGRINPRDAGDDATLDALFAALRGLRADIQRGSLDANIIEIAGDLEAKLDDLQRYDGKRKAWLQAFVGAMLASAALIPALAALAKSADLLAVGAVSFFVLLAGSRGAIRLAFYEQRNRLAASLSETIQLCRTRTGPVVDPEDPDDFSDLDTPEARAVLDRFRARIRRNMAKKVNGPRTGVRVDVAREVDESNDAEDELESEAEADEPKQKEKK